MSRGVLIPVERLLRAPVPVHSDELLVPLDMMIHMAREAERKAKMATRDPRGSCIDLSAGGSGSGSSWH